jgi:hypothetical protein
MQISRSAESIIKDKEYFVWFIRISTSHILTKGGFDGILLRLRTQTPTTTTTTTSI